MSEITPGGRKKKEDEYFAKLEFERKRKKLEVEHHLMKETEKKKLKETHWMRCPKCGLEMVELEFEGVKIDKCSECLGVFLDNGELEQIIEQKDAGLMTRFTKLFK